MEKSQRVFTLDEANALLPELETLLASVSAKKARQEKLHDVYFIQELLDQIVPEKGPEMNESEAQILDALVHEMQADILRLKEFGCIVRNLERGCIDFPAAQ